MKPKTTLLRRLLSLFGALALNAVWLLALTYWIVGRSHPGPSEVFPSVDVVTEDGMPIGQDEAIVTFPDLSNRYTVPTGRSIDLRTRQPGGYKAGDYVTAPDSSRLLHIPIEFLGCTRRLASLETKRTIDGQAERRLSFAREPEFVAVSRSLGLVAFATSEAGIAVHDADTLALNRTLSWGAADPPGSPGREWGTPWTATFLHHRPALIVSHEPAPGSSTCAVVVWDIAASRPGPVFAGHKHVVSGIAVSPDDQLVATVGFDRDLRVWSSVTGEELWRASLPGAEPSAVAFSHDGLYLAAGDFAGNVSLWETRTARKLMTWDLSPAIQRAGPSDIRIPYGLGPDFALNSHVYLVRSVGFSRQTGQIIAYCGQHAFTCRLPLLLRLGG